MPTRRRKRETYEEMRKRLIRETEVVLAHAIERPELFKRIPTVEAGHGGFDRALAERYWRERLGPQGPA